MEFGHWTEEEIAAQIQKKARSYVPEWRFLQEAPDIGSALALVYGRMLSGTAFKLSSIPYKNHIAFFQALDAKLLPAVPSDGFVSFQLSEDALEGAEIQAGQEVLAPAQDAGEEEVLFETLDDIYVTPSKVSCLLQVSGQQDYIGMPDITNLNKQGVFLFAYQSKNLQKHRLYFCHDDALSMAGAGSAAVDFLLRGEAAAQDFLKKLSDPGLAEFLYSTESGFVPFHGIRQEGSSLVLSIGDACPPFAKLALEGRESYWICCEVRRLEPFARFCFDAMRIAPGCGMRPPDYIYANGLEISGGAFFPFGEQFTDYNEAYLLADDVFRKKGGEVTLSFYLDFVEIPLDYEETATAWKWIMHKSDIKQDLEIDVSIAQVVWEYYNGNGWTDLFGGQRYGDIFCAKKGAAGRYVKLCFICPQDAAPILVNAREGRYIRVRVVKVNNLYKLHMRGNYISPVMDHVTLQYSYAKYPVSPQMAVTENNRERQRHFFHGAQLAPFAGPLRDGLYLGFDTAPVGGPVKILFDFAQRLAGNGRTLSWAYSGKQEAWHPLDVVDGTQQMTKAGIVTFTGSSKFGRQRLYGVDNYWIRISQADAGKEKPGSFPCLCGLYMNTVRIRQRDKAQTEYFHREIYEEHLQIQLAHSGVTSCSLWVDERGSLGQEEFQTLEKANCLSAEYREDGELQRAWIKWEQADDFLNSTGSSRHYVLDGRAGSIRFGDGRAGKIPPAAKADNIRVRYDTGGGEHTNVQAAAVTQLNRAVSGVFGVFNPKRLTGGSDAETLDHALRRHAAALRHQNRPITARDFEELALEASRSLRRVTCFSGYDAHGHRRSGTVTLVLQQDHNDARERFYDIKAEVENYFEKMAYSGLFVRGRLFCTAPQFIELSVRLEASVSSMDEVFLAKKQIVQRLARFFDPLDGNFDGNGWEVGTLPNAVQIRNAVSSGAGFYTVETVYLSAYLGEQAGRTEVDLDKIKKHKYILPRNGSHEIILHVGYTYTHER